MTEPTKKETDVLFPPKLQELFRPHRYKILYGGRGGSKSWGIARALLILGFKNKLRILCTRETQKSITDSVHKLLSDQVEGMGLGGFYEVQQTTIKGLNGTEFIFAGLKQNIYNLKSYESVDICWVEEAHTVRKHSWDVLIPTIRKDNSEIWISFNPELETDETYKRFIQAPPPGSEVIAINWRDNPWFPEVLRQELEYCKEQSYEDYLHIWEGQCVQNVEGAVFVDQLRAMDVENRVTSVKFDPSRPVETFWDLGYGDATAIWFVQSFPYEYRFINYIEGNRFILKHYQQELQRLQMSEGYVYRTHYLPHDAESKDLRTGRSIKELMLSYGFPVQIVPKLSINDTINAARTLFPQCWFDGEKCADGIQALRHYRWGPLNLQGVMAREPVHDWASHGGSAFRYAGVILKPAPIKEEKTDYRDLDRYGYDEQNIGVWS